MAKIIDIKRLVEIKQVKNNFDCDKPKIWNLKIDVDFEVYDNQLLRLSSNILPEYLIKTLNSVQLKKVNNKNETSN